MRRKFRRPVWFSQVTWFSRLHSPGFAQTKKAHLLSVGYGDSVQPRRLTFYKKNGRYLKFLLPREREEADKETGQQGERKAPGHRKGSIELFKLRVSDILFLSDFFGHRVNPIHCCKPQSSQLHRKNFNECFSL